MTSHIFHTSSEMETVRDIKEKRCYVAFNIDKLEKDDSDTLEPTVPYKLPDGNSISIGAEQFRAPEILFNPSIIGLEYSGIHQCLLDSISRYFMHANTDAAIFYFIMMGYRCDMDLRRSMFADTVLAGGSTLFKGITIHIAISCIFSCHSLLILMEYE